MIEVLKLTVNDLKNILENLPDDILICCNEIDSNHLLDSYDVVFVDSDDEDFYISENVLLLHTK